MNDIQVTNKLGVLKLYQATATDVATGISRTAESDRLNEARGTATRELCSALAALRLADELDGGAA
ncbi:MAG TPA: hypothetical protein VIQ30_25505 [Pseudonocardia sp.]